MANTNSIYSVAKTGVFWDLEDCPIPEGLNPVLISKNIRTALRNAGYNGELSITAYANESSQVPEEGFVSAGIDLVHVPEGEKGKDRSRDNYITDDSSFGWITKNGREPANLMVITDYTSDIMLGSMKGYGFNILLALPDHGPGPQHTIVRVVSSIWYWESLSAGGKPIENVASCPRCGRFRGDADAPEAAKCDH